MTRFFRMAIILFASSLLGCASAFAAKAYFPPPPKPSPAVEQAIRNMFGVRMISQAAISPDGKHVAWVESLTGKNGAPSFHSAIYVANWRSAAATRRITASKNGVAASESDLAWSPNSRSLAFFSDAGQPGQRQLYVTALNGTPRRMTHVTGDVSAPRWSPDGKSIAFLYIPNAPRAAGPLAAETRPEGVIRTVTYEQRLAVVEVATARLREISPTDMYVYEYDWSPSGSKIIATAARGNGDNNWWIAQIYAFNAVHAEAPQPIYQSPLSRQIGDPRCSPDGKSVAFIGGIMSDEISVGGDIYTVPASGGRARDITPGIKATPTSVHWAADSRSIVFSEIADGRTGIGSVDINSGRVTTLYTGAERIGSGFGAGVSLSRDGKIAGVVRQSFSQPPEVWAGPIGKWRQITHLNSGLHPEWGKAQSLHWQTDIGEVQGWLLYPSHYDALKKYGLIVVIHGGPAAANLQSWPTRRAYYDAMSADGFFVLFPNPRGSYGSGEAFTRANVKDFGGGDFRDIMAGVSVATASLPIDPQRVGITGWSYGGYMSMWAVTQTHRFKAAVIGAGLSDWLSYYGENDIDRWMIPYFGASVYDDPAVYAKSAPINFIKNARTPSLIVVGDSDGECPPPQSFEFWRALVNFHVPSELVVYPNEGHGFAKPADSRDVLLRAVAWFNHYLQR